MKKRTTSQRRKQETISTQHIEETPLQKLVRSGMMEFVMQAGIESILELIEEEITGLCGERYRNIVGRTCYRWGAAETAMVMAGKKVMVKRGRVRQLDGQEIQLKSIAALQDIELLTERQLEQMLIGVSTRKYRRSLEALPAETRAYSDSKSSVSRRFVMKSKKMLHDWLHRRIVKEYPILMIDGTVFKNTTIIIVLGIARDGEKKVLGIWNGSNENYEVCKDLISNLIDRGLDSSKVRLAVLDGGKAIRKTVDNVFGESFNVQRCQVHKLRNVMAYLSDSMQPSVSKAMMDAYRSGDYETAKQALMNLANKLKATNVQAANSLAEGMEETLTLHRLGITGALKKSLSSTNLIENLNGSIKRHTGRVKRWRNPNMILRWVFTGINEAEKGFRRIKGYRQIESLMIKLDHNITSEGESLDKHEEAA